MSRRPHIHAPLIALMTAVMLWLPLQGRAADRANLEAFLEVTGFDVALESIKQSASDAPEMLGMKPGDFGHDWARVSKDVFDTEKMHDMAIEILSETLSDDLLGHAAGFYASPLGQKLVKLENASHMAEDSAAQRAEGAELLAESREAGNGRAEMFERMADAIDTEDQSVRAVQEIMVRFLMAASNAGVLDYQIDEAALRAVIRNQEDEMRENMMEAGLANAAYTYRDLTLEELEAYTEALETPEMQRVYELMNAIQYEVMANRFEVLAARMAEMHPGQEL